VRHCATTGQSTDDTTRPCARGDDGAQTISIKYWSGVERCLWCPEAWLLFADGLFLALTEIVWVLWSTPMVQGCSPTSLILYGCFFQRWRFWGHTLYTLDQLLEGGRSRWCYSNIFVFHSSLCPLLLNQIALLSSCRSFAKRPWFQNEKPRLAECQPRLRKEYPG